MLRRQALPKAAELRNWDGMLVADGKGAFTVGSSMNTGRSNCSKVAYKACLACIKRQQDRVLTSSVHNYHSLTILHDLEHYILMYKIGLETNQLKHHHHPLLYIETLGSLIYILKSPSNKSKGQIDNAELNHWEVITHSESKGEIDNAGSSHECSIDVELRNGFCLKLLLSCTD